MASRIVSFVRIDTKISDFYQGSGNFKEGAELAIEFGYYKTLLVF